MKLTRKCLIDFRSWLGENHDMRMWQFDDLPEFVQNAYCIEFLKLTETKKHNQLITFFNDVYNEKFEK